MDRDKRYDRLQKAYDVMVNPNEEVKDYKKYIEDSYKNNITDEYIVPININKEGIIEDNDSIIWCNFRADRSIEILDALTNDFNEFETKKLNNIYLTTMMYVSDNIKSDIAFKKEEVNKLEGK